MTLNRTYVIGDIGGRLEIFRRTLLNLGINPDSPVIPQDTTLIQVGDIVRMYSGPAFDNEGCLNLATRLQLLNPDSYVQLWGNHEYGAVNWPFPGSPWRLSDSEALAIKAQMGAWSGRVAVAVGDTLLTHAGLTHGRWVALGRPASAHAAADKLNARSVSILARRAPLGWLLNGRRPSDFTDCLWAEAATETYPSWLHSGEAMPFDQVHGHDTPFDHDAGRIKDHAPADIAAILNVDTGNRRTMLELPRGGTFTCVDWVLTDRPHRQNWDLLQLHPAGHLLAA